MPQASVPSGDPQLSVVVVAYQMARELPRTLQSLSPSYQHLARDRYEVIVVDNGSSPPVRAEDFAHLDLPLVVVRVASPTHSPVPAINRGLEVARGGLIGVFIDGARMASPGMLNLAIRASRLSDRPVISTLAFHLGPDVQMRSVPNGYDHKVEDGLLASIGWPGDGYRLFEIAAFAGSSSGGWFLPISETNGLFLTRDMWLELGGFDPGFVSPGGGLCNLDAYRRACDLPGAELIVLLGEGTFHQVHGGIATNTPNPPMDLFFEEYVRLRGEPYKPPTRQPQFLGAMPPSALPSVAFSAVLSHPEGKPAARFSLSPPGSVQGRPYTTAVAPSLLASIQDGVLKTHYRGVPCLKSPFDLALYSALIDRLRPRTVIEIGGKHGGSALWFADRMSVDGASCRVISVDIDPRFAFEDARIEVILGDARDLQAALPPALLSTLERPWLVVEDSAHTEEVTRSVIEFFAPRLLSGEYLVVEDGVVAFLPDARYRAYNEGPNRAVSGYLQENPRVFEVDAELCDFFGFNVTYNPNGWLRRR